MSKKILLKVLYDHWKILATFLLAAGGLSLVYLIRDSLLSFISWRYSAWIILATCIAAYFTIYIIKKNRRIGTSFYVSSSPPIYRKWEVTKPIPLYGVNWRFWRGNSSLFSSYGDSENEYRGWVDGPYCAECDYELDRDYKKHRWTCANGHGAVSIPKTVREDTRKKVIKVLEAEYRRQKAEGKI